MGEIGLAGELRRVRDLPQRLAEAARLGFRVAVVPAERSAQGSDQPRGPRAARTREIDGLKVLEVPDVASALRLLALTKDRHGLRAVDE
jgi:DNA repair protein RadA/Sms